jgi:hypothetical protein
VSYTPGPWTLDEMEQDGHMVGTEAQPFVAHVFKGEWNEPTLPDAAECSANARLIAAAPDLLKAADSLLWVWNNRHNYGTDRFREFLGAAAEDAAKAKAKATGETP